MARRCRAIQARVSADVSSAYTWSPRRRRTSGRSPSGSAASRAERVSSTSGPTGSDSPTVSAAHRHEPKATTAPVAGIGGVWMVLGGWDESASGHTRSPSSSTSYSVAEPGASPVTTTSA